MNKHEPVLIVVCGFSGVGKTTIAKKLGTALKLHVADNDAIIRATFGEPPGVRGSEEYRNLEFQYYGAGYRMLYFSTEELLRIGSSVIVTAQFSSYEHGQLPLMNIAEKTGARLKVVWLRGDPSNMSNEELSRFLAERAKHDYLGSVEQVDFFNHLYNKFEPIKIPGACEVATWPKQSPEKSFEQALAYCRDSQSGYKPGAVTP